MIRSLKELAKAVDVGENALNGATVNVTRSGSATAEDLDSTGYGGVDHRPRRQVDVLTIDVIHRESCKYISLSSRYCSVAGATWGVDRPLAVMILRNLSRVTASGELKI
jgi:hypothetical protein